MSLTRPEDRKILEAFQHSRWTYNEDRERRQPGG
jgi:hypothetical protein